MKALHFLFFFCTCACVYSQYNVSEGVTLMEEGQRMEEEGNYNSAELLFDSAAVIFNNAEEYNLYVEAVSFRLDMMAQSQKYNEAISISEKLILEYSSLISGDKRLIAISHNAIGLNYVGSQASISKGVSYLNQAMAAARLLSNSERLKRKIAFNIAGAFYYQAHYDSAIRLFQEIIESSNKNKLLESKCLLAIGNCYWGLGRLNKASFHYDESLLLLHSMKEVDSLAIGKTLHSKGYIFMDSNKLEDALNTFKSAANYLSSSLPQIHPHAVWIYGDVGRAYNALEQYDSALIYLQKALKANVYDFEKMDYHENPKLTNVNDVFQQFMILKLKGEALSGKYLKVPLEKDLQTLYNTYDLADQQVDEIRMGLSSSDQSNLGYYSEELYFKAIRDYIRIYEKYGDPAILEKIHFFFEKQSITRVQLRFLEVIAKSSNILPEEIANKEALLISKLERVKTKILKQKSDKGDSLQILETTRFELEQSLDSLLIRIKNKYPKYHQTKYNFKPVSLKTIQEKLKNLTQKTGVVSSYTSGETLYTSLITKDTAVFLSQKTDERLEEVVSEFRKEILEQKPIENSKSNDLLYDYLFGRISLILDTQKIETLVIARSPSLQLFPFELLHENKFLFEKFNISYHYSSTIFADEEIKGLKTANSDYLGLAPDFSSITTDTLLYNEQYGNLPGAKIEIESISSILRGQVLTDQLATEEEFRKHSSDAGIIHLATHAVIDELSPEASFLQMSKTDTVQKKDGKLHFFEIYNLNLNAQLVTLSACNTGFGKIQKGEGVMSLSRAFAYAGVPATVVSLWPASDKSTPELMKHFYQNLKDGQAKDVALNNARKQYLATAKGKARHPFYWGGFVLIGDNSPIEEDANLLVWVIPGVLVIVMILTVYRRKRKSKVAPEV
ncbi:CHAT domain-containing protein [Ekhidna sp.]